MKKLYSTIMMLTMMIAASSFAACSSSDDDEKCGGKFQDYDVLQINGEDYACYGHRCIITYTSTWDLSKHKGKLLLPCGKLSDAQKGEYDYDYMFHINLKGKQDLETGSKLEDYSPTFSNFGEMSGSYYYESGSATITDKRDDDYITVKFDSFCFSKGSKLYSLNGTVQLSLDED